MTIQRDRLVMRCGLLFASFSLTGCSRAPSFDIVGSFFPAWLLCLLVAIVLTGLSAWLLRRVSIPVAVPVLIYPSLTAFFALALWLLFFD